MRRLDSGASLANQINWTAYQAHLLANVDYLVKYISSIGRYFQVKEVKPCLKADVYAEL